ncbi:MAG: hypothetical protein QMC78_00875 [Methanocellales archaeon]|nr:hypothetical protein [Methanocellales archaeon]
MENRYIRAADAYLDDAIRLRQHGGWPAGMISQCWLAVSECIQALPEEKGIQKIFDHKRIGELLLRYYPSETVLLGIYNDLRRIHRDTYDDPLAITMKDAELAIEDAKEAIRGTKEIVKSQM